MPEAWTKTISRLLGAVALASGLVLHGPIPDSAAQSIDLTEPVVPQPGPSNSLAPVFSSPFLGTPFITDSYFDHDLPFEFQDTNGFQLTFWGERVYAPVDGHNGYDFRAPEGTPLFAVADGTVIFAGVGDPVQCPILGNREVQNSMIMIAHRYPRQAPDGSDLVVYSRYLHVSQMDVPVGRVVHQGDPIGLTGNVGCSTAPHLHFEVERQLTGRSVVIDPYGWEGEGADPWAEHPSGAESLWLWQDGQAPPLYRQVVSAPNPGPNDNARLAITRARWQGWGDAAEDSQDFVELTLDPRFVPGGRQVMSGYTLQLRSGDTFSFPDDFAVQDGQPALLVFGSGDASATTLYWDARPNPMGECFRLVGPGGGTYLFGVGPDGVCP